jgi:nucleoside phosphorylase
VPVTGGRLGHARVAVLSVIREETVEVRAAFGLTERVPTWPYFVPPGVDPARPDVINREVGRANIRCYERSRDMIEHWQPEVLLLCGIAGGIDGRDDIAVGDVVIPEYVHYCSFAKLSEDGQQRRYLPYDHPSVQLHPRYAEPLGGDDSWITDALRARLPADVVPKVLTGSLVAGDKIYGAPNSEEQAKIVKEFDEAVAIDMESVGLCRAAAAARTNPQYNPRLLIVRSISDLIGAPANNEMRTKWKPLTAAVAATFAHQVVSDFLSAEPDPRPSTGGVR